MQISEGKSSVSSCLSKGMPFPVFPSAKEASWGTPEAEALRSVDASRHSAPWFSEKRSGRMPCPSQAALPVPGDAAGKQDTPAQDCQSGRILGAESWPAKTASLWGQQGEGVGQCLSKGPWQPPGERHPWKGWGWTFFAVWEAEKDSRAEPRLTKPPP